MTTTTLNDILTLIPMEDQWIYVFDTEGIWNSAKKEKS